jgi:hypothetical protein
VDSLFIFQRLLLRPRFAVIRDHLPSRFLCGSPCKLLRCCVWALGTLGVLYSGSSRRQPRRRGRAPQRYRSLRAGAADTWSACGGRPRGRVSKGSGRAGWGVGYATIWPSQRSVGQARSGRRAELTQLVECQLPKLDVAGSTPVLRSITLVLPCLPGTPVGIIFADHRRRGVEIASTRRRTGDVT